MNKYIKINKKLNKKSKRVGRGTSSGKGKTSGRGQKGQKARSGGKIPYLGFEGGQMPLYKRIPKKGFTSKNKKEIEIINLNDLKNFDSSEVTVESLKLRGLIKKNSKIVKLLGEGDIDKTLIVKLHLISKSAKEKLENKGGSFEKIS